MYLRENINLNLPNDIASCHELILAQQVMIQNLLNHGQQIEQLEAKVKQLEARLHQNSGNSHRPPSSDGLRKQPAFPRKKGNKQGGQRGHKGKTLDMVAHPDHLINHAPQRCSCGYDLRDVAKQTIECRQVFDLPHPKLEISQHQLQSCVCPKCQRNNVGIFPDAIAARVQYGNGVRALTVLLNTGFKLPFGKIRQFFIDVFGYALNESTQINAQVRCYEQLAESEQCIRQKLLNSVVNHFDETGLRVQGKPQWLHNCSNSEYTYQFIHSKRGQQALDDQASLLPHYKGWAIHDCWRSYFLYRNCRHGTCNAHLLRELQSLIEQGSRWAGQMKDLLLRLYKKW